MKDLEQQLIQLRKLTDHDSLEFYQYLRIVLQGSYRYNMNYLAHLIGEFEVDILEHGVFYIDVLNENLLYFIKKERKLSPLQANLFLLIIEKLLSICDRQSLDLLKFFLKKQHKQEIQVIQQVREYMGVVEKRLEAIEQKKKELHLHPYKDIIKQWY